MDLAKQIADRLDDNGILTDREQYSATPPCIRTPAMLAEHHIQAVLDEELAGIAEGLVEKHGTKVVKIKVSEDMVVAHTYLDVMSDHKEGLICKIAAAMREIGGRSD